MFLSQQKRLDYCDLRERGPAVGTYELNHKDISEVTQKKTEHVNPLLSNLKQKTTFRPFNTSAKRFDGKKTDENDAFLGPGYYENQTHIIQSKPTTKALSTMGGVRSKLIF